MQDINLQPKHLGRRLGSAQRRLGTSRNRWVDPTLVTEGSSSCISSSLFGNTSTFRVVTPVTFAPGRLRLVTSPALTGSAPDMKTIGTLAVTDFAASAVAMPPAATITATRS